MTIHKFFRLFSLSVASLFWASCGNDSNPQFPVAQAANPDSSSDANESSDSSSEFSSSAVAPESSSSDTPPQSSSSESASSSSGVESSSSANSSSSSLSVSSSSSIPTYVLARDSSITCETFWQTVPICSKNYDCDDLKNFLKPKQSVSEKLLTFWEQELESCGAIQLLNATVYGISPCASTRMKYKMKCSNDSTYLDFITDGNLAYTSENEYNEAKGIVPKDLVESCPQEDFALFSDILADVQKELYKKIVDELMIDSSLTEAQIKYLENLLDRENKTLKVGLAPYYLENRPVERSNLNYMAENWFDGYIAKTKTCEDGTPEITERYKQKYDAILAECMEIIRNNVKTAVAGE